MTDVLVPPAVAVLQPWVDNGVLGTAEVQLAAVVAEAVAGEAGAGEVALGVALALWAPQHGHTCVDVDTVAASVDAAVAVTALDDDFGPGVDAPPLPWPSPQRWIGALAASAAVRVVDEVDRRPHLDERPLVLHGRRLYLQRQWFDECTVAAALAGRAGRAGRLDPRPSAAATALDGLLPSVDGGADQHAAAATAGNAALTVIVGGPGTGKTHTVAGLLAAELSADPELRIGLAAPTGKAAARLTEALVATAASASSTGTIGQVAGEQLAGLRAGTVHRLLGPRPDHRSRFQRTAADPLSLDLLVIDETSMLALPLTARLLEAVPDHCRLVLVGDPDQLSSVEVGAVLADVVAAAARPQSPLSSCVVRLTRQHRTGEGSPIGPLAEAIRTGDADAAVDLLVAGDDPRLRFVEVADGTVSRAAVATVLAAVGPDFAAARDAAGDGDLAAAFTAAARARILCTHRRGPFGVTVWNEHVEGNSGDRHRGAGGRRADTTGRALLATRNDVRTGIANGDHGVLVRLGSGSRAVFRRGGELVAFDPAELDAVETAFAITVHKSQGSEYRTVALVHPPAGSPLVSRQLLYTAVTRAAAELVVVASVASIRKAVTTPSRRVTGLVDALAEGDTAGTAG